MEIKPIKKYSIPVYPQKEVVNRDPSVLKSIPQRWKNNASLGVMLSGLLILPLAGCGVGQTAGEVAPPMNLLTEEDARQIIMDEAKKEGINFEVTDKEIKNIDLRFTGSYDKDGKTVVSEAAITFQLDGLDENKLVGFEFITGDDFYEWTEIAKEQGKLEYCGFDEATAAKDLQEAANKNVDNIIVGTFYNPTDTMTVDESKEALRVQVKEFIEWLKAEGVI